MSQRKETKHQHKVTSTRINICMCVCVCVFVCESRRGKLNFGWCMPAQRSYKATAGIMAKAWQYLRAYYTTAVLLLYLLKQKHCNKVLLKDKC